MLLRMLGLAGITLALSMPGVAAAEESMQMSQDQAAIQAMRAQEIDLSKPHTLEFAFHFPSLDEATRTWNALVGQGYKGALRPAGSGEDYMLFVRKRVMVDTETLAALRAQFEALAEAGQGTYEGWGTP